MFVSKAKQSTSTNITVIQVYAPTSNAEEAERFFEDLQDLLELTPKCRCPFHYSGLECKSRKSRNTWSNRQIWRWSIGRSRAKANRVLPRECAGHSKHPLPKTHIDHILCSQRWRISIQSAKTSLEADCGSDTELFTPKFRLKLKKCREKH